MHTRIPACSPCSGWSRARAACRSNATGRGSMLPPVPGAFVVNIGELLEYATGGYLKATNHRVVSPQAPDERISIPFFFNPALDKRLPLIELPEELAAEAKGVTEDPSNPITRTLRGERAQVTSARATPTSPPSTTPTSWAPRSDRRITASVRRRGRRSRAAPGDAPRRRHVPSSSTAPRCANGPRR